MTYLQYKQTLSHAYSTYFLPKQRKNLNFFILTIKIINIKKFTRAISLFILSISTLSFSLWSLADSNPNNQATQDLLLAEFAINNNQPLKALEIYQKIATMTNDPSVARRATELALENGKDEEALSTVKIWADSDKTSAKAQLIASLLVMQYKEVSEAKNYLYNLLTIKPVETKLATDNQAADEDADLYAYIELLINHPFDNAKLEQIKSLLLAIQQDVKTNSSMDKTYIYIALSLLYEKLGEGELSLHYINEALKQTPKLQTAHIHKIRLLNIYKSTDEALSYLEDTIATFPTNYELRKLYADILYDLEDWPKAKAHYETLAKQDVYQQEVLLQLAYINITNNDIIEARKNLLKLTQSAEYSNIANYNLGLIAMQLDKTDDAVSFFNAVKDGEFYIRSKVRLASIHTKKQEFEQAKQILDNVLENKQAIDIDGYIKEIILSEAEVLYQQGLYSDALAILNTIKSHYPSDPDIHYSIGILAIKLDNTDLFTENMDFVIKNNPSNIDALSALGWHYYKNNDNDKALQLLQQAYVADHFNSTRVGSRYAAILWRMGQTKQAEEIWQKFLELDPHNQALRDMIEKTKSVK